MLKIPIKTLAMQTLGKGQSENVPTVTESFVNNEKSESTSENDKTASYSDNLIAKLDDHSNTNNDIDTHEVLQVMNSRFEMNPEFHQVSRMTSVPETDGESCTVARIPDKLDLDDGKDISDAVILHAEDDKQLVSEFIQNMETEFQELQLNFKIFEQLNIGKGILESAPLLFRTCRFVFVFMTKIFEQDDLSKYVSQMLLLDSITFEEKSSRLIPILKDVYYNPVFAPVIPLMYNRYLEHKSQKEEDSVFLKSFKKLVIHGRRSYLTS